MAKTHRFDTGEQLRKNLRDLGTDERLNALIDHSLENARRFNKFVDDNARVQSVSTTTGGTTIIRTGSGGGGGTTGSNIVFSGADGTTVRTVGINQVVDTNRRSGRILVGVAGIVTANFIQVASSDYEVIICRLYNQDEDGRWLITDCMPQVTPMAVDTRTQISFDISCPYVGTLVWAIQPRTS